MQQDDNDSLGNATARPPASRDNPGVVAFPPLIWLVGALLSGLCRFLSPHPILSYRVALPIGIVFLLAAPTLVFSALRVMRAAGTNVNPSQPSLVIVRGGPYRFTRNPMYLALCLLQTALAFLLDDWVALLLVIPLALILHYGVILREERYLEAKFGEPYLALKREVRRWI